MSGSSELPPSQQNRTDEDAASAIPRHMSQASLFSPHYSSPYHHPSQYPNPHAGFGYQQHQQHQQQQQQQQQPNYVPQHVGVHHQQGGHSLPTHYHHQPMPHNTMPSYHQPYSRKRSAAEMDTPLLGSGVNMTPSMGYSMSTPGMMTAATMPSVSSISGLGISTMHGHGYDADPNSASHMSETTLVPPLQQPKKGRTNTPWTPAEEQRLKTMRDAGNSWSEIAKTFPNRTEGSVKKHWYKDMHYADFADNEGSFKQALIAAIKDYEQNKWKVIGAKVGKPAKACESYAKEHNLLRQQ